MLHASVHIFIDWQIDIRACQPILQPTFLRTELRDYQLLGVTKILKMLEGPTLGCINGDEMGLGKTITTITACLLGKDVVPGAFNLVVTTSASASQWEEELYHHFHPVSE